MPAATPSLAVQKAVQIRPAGWGLPSNHQQPFAVEICCGQASLSRELINVGFSVLAVDHVMHDPQVPVTLLALTQASHQKILIDLLHNRPPDYIHLGMGSLLAYEAQNNFDLTKFLGFTHRNFLSQLLPWRPKEKRHPLEIHSRCLHSAHGTLPK